MRGFRAAATPIAATFGIDPVQLGVIFLANLELGYPTPPVGMNLCLSAYRFKKPMTTIDRTTVPFYIILPTFPRSLRAR